MALTELQFKNFKSWEDTGPIRFGSITGFFGTNSSGKSSILQLLLLLKQTAASSDRKAVLDFGNENSLVELGTFEDIIHNRDKSNRLSLQITWHLPEPLKILTLSKTNQAKFSAPEITLTSEISLRQARLMADCAGYKISDLYFSIYNKDEIYQFDSNFADMKSMHKDDKRLPSPVKFYRFPDLIRARYSRASFLSDFEFAFEEQLDKIYYLGPLRDYPRRQYIWGGATPSDVGKRGEKAVDALIASGTSMVTTIRDEIQLDFTLEKHVAWWLKELGLIHSFSVRQLAGSELYRVYVQKAPDSTEILITDVGFGVSQILPVLVLCFYVPEGSTIILEQPEIHLHPSVQAGLADVFIDAIKKRNVQIILESHSEHLLLRLQRRIAEEKISSEDARLYFCTIDQGVSHLHHLELDPYGNIKNWPENFFGDEFGETAAMTEAIIERKVRESA